MVDSMFVPRRDGPDIILMSIVFLLVPEISLASIYLWIEDSRPMEEVQIFNPSLGTPTLQAPLFRQ